MRTRIDIDFFQITDVGRQRSNNEDAMAEETNAQGLRLSDQEIGQVID